MAISVEDAQDILKKDFPARHDEFLRQKIKFQRQSMILTITAEEMPAQLKKAAKSVRFVIFMNNDVIKLSLYINF
jgi:hypothetical protein